MTSKLGPQPAWGSQYRLVASEKWRVKSAALGKPVTEGLVDLAQPTPGMRVLDLASGTGEPAITLAERVGPSGHVTALDLSEELLEIASKRAQNRGLTNLTTKQADAHHLPFPDESFDLATSRFGVMFFRDPEQALGELRRALRPGARACFLAWGPFDQPYWQTTMGVVHERVGGTLLDPDGPDPFRFSTPGSLSKVLQAASFDDIQEEATTFPWVWPCTGCERHRPSRSTAELPIRAAGAAGPGPPEAGAAGCIEEVWEQARSVAVPFRPMLDRVPAEQWPEIHAAVHQAVSRYVVDGGIAFGATVVLASGKK